MRTMTLEELVAYCGTAPAHARTREAVLVAIRERDELLARIATLQSEVAKQINIGAQSDAELAALDSRVNGAPFIDADDLAAYGVGIPKEWAGKRVWILVEDDDDSH